MPRLGLPRVGLHGPGTFLRSMHPIPLRRTNDVALTMVRRQLARFRRGEAPVPGTKIAGFKGCVDQMCRVTFPVYCADTKRPAASPAARSSSRIEHSWSFDPG